MSYILDALKKSESERSRGAIPRLQTASRLAGHNRSLWVGVFIGAAGLSIIGAASWFIDLRFRQPDTAPGPTATANAGVERGASAPRAEPTKHFRTAGEAPVLEAPPAGPIRVRGVSEMDPVARARVEGLSVDVVLYSDTPARRFVMLNQRIVRESDTVAGGVVVKRILRRGVLLQVGKYEILLRPD